MSNTEYKEIWTIELKSRGFFKPVIMPALLEQNHKNNQGKKLETIPNMRKPTATPNLIRISIAAALLLHIFTATAQPPNFQTFTAQYGPFDQTYYDILEIINPASIGAGALRLTPDTASEYNGTLYSRLTSARILLKQQFKLWEDGNGPVVASFNTSFLFNIYRPENTTAQGLAFVLAPDLTLPPNSNNYFLGLTNSVTNGNTDNKFIAVELDTDKQDFDPDDNHVGIDVNSIVSIKNESLTRHNITIAPVGPNGRFHNVWIDYDGVNKVMDVYIAEQAEKDSPTPEKPGSPILSAESNLRDHLNQFSYFGFSASSGSDQQMTRVLRWNLTVHHFSDPLKSSPGKWWKVALGCGAAALVLLAASIVGYLAYKKRAGSLNKNLMGALNTLPGMPREFKFKDLKKATNNFSKHNKLGQGGFGEVYKGMLVKENTEIAVKRFSRENIKGQNDFLAELTIINRLRHKHLVKLLGWCYKNGKLLLVYEYMPNGSLDQHLFIGPDKEPLEWNLRLQIMSCVASALHYLHNECEQKVVHRDLKASNIMLDSNFNARLGDFGLARALENGKTSYTEVGGVMGTMGYIAPECFLTGKATRQSDIYAFGAVILELVCGQRPGTNIAGFQFLVDWVWLLHRDGKLLEAVDQKMGDKYITKEAERMLLLGLACSHPNPNERPKTENILHILSGTISVPRVPPFKPAFVWPAGRPMDMDSSSTGPMTSS